MFRKIIIYVTLICFIACVQGCTSRYTIPTEELEQKPKYKNVTIETVDGEVYEFIVVNVHDDYLEGYVRHRGLLSIPTEDVKSVSALKHDSGKTALYVFGFVVIGLSLAAIIALMSFSPEITIELQ